MRPLRVEIVGGGPGGLFLARLLRLADPSCVVRVHERGSPGHTFGFGVVFSDRTMSSIASADPQTCALIRRASVSWSDMELRPPGARLRYGGYGFTAISRHELLRILRRQARRAGAEVRFHQDLDVHDLNGDGVTVLADGARSRNRQRFAGRFGTTIETGAARYIWFGTEAAFDAVTFPFVPTEHGVFAAHAYPYGPGMSTFIVETDEETWHKAGLAAAVAPGRTDERSRQLLSEVFAEHLGGRPLIGNGSRWHRFRVVRNARWWAGNTVLLGDAAHTAHFSVGSGTKLAMEDAVALADALTRAGDLPGALRAYEAARRGAVTRTQALAARSMRWWESYGRRMHLPPHRFGLHFITRTGAIGYEGLNRRHRDRVAEAEAEFAALAVAGAPPSPPHSRGAPVARGLPYASAPAAGEDRPDALSLPVTVGRVRLPSRIAVRTAGHAGRALPAGAGLVLADLRGADPGDCAVPAVPGTVPGILVDLDLPPARIGRAVRAGVRVVEVFAHDGPPQPAEVTALLDELPGGEEGPAAALVAGVRCPGGDPWSDRAERLLDHCRALRGLGLAALHLHGCVDPRGRDGAGPGEHGRREPEWEHLIAWADRIRTETGLPILLDGPRGWMDGCGVGETGDAGRARDDWATRLHLALVSGRADVIVAGSPGQAG